jgi:hypothetical protein
MNIGSGPQLIEFGGKGNSYWAQVQCPNCKAWLKEMPDHYETYPYEDDEYEGEDYDGEEIEKIDTLYIYYWTCLKCRHKRKVESFDTPGEHTPHPDGVEHEPGSLSEPIVRDPEKWKDADRLSEWEKKLVIYCWEMLDSLNGSFLIHKINYIWNLAAALENYDIEAVKRTAIEYVELLDYEKIHGKESGSYGGEEGDVTKIREALKGIGSS